MKIKKLFISVAILFLSVIILGIGYRFSLRFRQANQATSVDKEISVQPSPSPQSNSNSATKDLRLYSLSISYPADWLLLFSPIIDAKTPNITPVYFVRNSTEYRQQALCASTGSCTDAPLMINFSTPTKIWTGYTLRDFIQATYPDLASNKLTEVKFGDYLGLGGYTDYSKLTYQAFIPISQESLQTITVTATQTSQAMLELFIQSLHQVKTIQATNSPSAKFSYTLKLSARLATTDYNILQLILDNLLEPTNSTASASYTLYTETSRPPDNYLDYTYTLLTDNADLSVGDYSSAQITLTLDKPQLTDIIPYLDNPQYCRQNTDCIYRANFCTVSSYNRYHLFKTPWGCGSTTYLGLGDSQTLSENLSCRDGLDINYDSLECINNQCVVNNPVAVCKE